jgi:hypothetical protein
MIWAGKVNSLRIIFVLTGMLIGFCDNASCQDSTRAVFRITPRFNSAGHFPFTGSLLNTNLNFDLNFFYEANDYGFFVFKSVDLEDAHSYINYLQPGVFKKFELSPNLYMRAFVGYLFSQARRFKDKDSDYYTAVTLYWSLNASLKIEHTALFFDLSQSIKLANRFLMFYTIKDFKIELFVWNRWEFEKQFTATSASLALNFPALKIFRSVSMLNTISYQGYLSSVKPDFALQKGLLISVAFPINADKK